MRAGKDVDAIREARSNIEAEVSVFPGRYARYMMLREPPERPRAPARPLWHMLPAAY